MNHGGGLSRQALLITSQIISAIPIGGVSMIPNGRGLAVVLIVLFAWTNQAVASDHKKTCKHLGKMYMTAASLRDKGADRDMVFSQLRIMATSCRDTLSTMSRSSTSQNRCITALNLPRRSWPHHAGSLSRSAQTICWLSWTRCWQRLAPRTRTQERKHPAVQ